MVKLQGIIVVFLMLGLVVSCEKSDNRSCIKGHGEEIVRELPVDSVNFWHLNRRIKYRIFQDSLKKVVIKGGKNMVNMVNVQTEDYRLTVTNLNKCNFLRDYDRVIEVELHYPYFGDFYIEPSDSIIFEGTLATDTVRIELREGGGSLLLDAKTDFIELIVSNSTADYTLSGYSKRAELKVQHQGFGNAENFRAISYFIYSNSVADLSVNLDSAGVYAIIDGVGNIRYSGTPTALVESGNGSGQLVKQ